jgi:hypothetical protein
MNSINVVVAKKKPVHISTGATATSIVSSNPVTLKPDNIQLVSSGGGAVELTQLTDVDITQELDGSILQYNATTQNYQVKPLVTIDGGEF